MGCGGLLQAVGGPGLRAAVGAVVYSLKASLAANEEETQRAVSVAEAGSVWEMGGIGSGQNKS